MELNKILYKFLEIVVIVLIFFCRFQVRMFLMVLNLLQ